MNWCPGENGRIDLREGKVERPPWLIVADGELQQAEVPGPGNNPRIVEYFKATTYHATADAVPWCSAFLNWVMAKAGVKGSGSAAAISWLHWGLDLGEHPRLGCVVVFEHHVSLYVGPDPQFDNHIRCEGGNQSDRVKVSSYPLEDVLSYRWPKEA